MLHPLGERQNWVIGIGLVTAALTAVLVVSAFCMPSGSGRLVPPVIPEPSAIPPSPQEPALEPSPGPDATPVPTVLSESEGDEVDACATPPPIGGRDPVEPETLLVDDILAAKWSGVRPRAAPHPGALPVFWVGEAEEVEMVDERVATDDQGTAWIKVRELGSDPTTGWVQVSLLFFVARPCEPRIQ